MAKDPAFLFYPGDYLRDTQTFSPNTQVAYDRIMCEHMRNICISKMQLKFFIKRLTDDEKEELMMVLTHVKGGYQIDWVSESIEKRRAYSNSRRKNRQKHDLTYDKDMKTYDKHMENENENENVIIKEDVKKRKLFVKPTIEEVQKYCKERKNKVNPQTFIDHYISNGWKVGKNPMKDWKATVRNWERREIGDQKEKLQSIKQPEYKHFEDPTDEEREDLRKVMDKTRATVN